jgi:hypothetical protein
MKVPKGVVKLDMELVKIAEQIEVVAARKRHEGQQAEARDLFHLRMNIREGKISLEEAEDAFKKLQQ